MPVRHQPPLNGLGTLELLLEADRERRLPWDEHNLLRHVAWVWAQRTAACPDGMKAHSLKQIYDDLNGALDESANALVWDHKHRYFKEQHSNGSFDKPCSWRIEEVMDNCGKYDEGHCHGGVLQYAYVDSSTNHNSVDWTTYDEDLHCVQLVLYTGEKVNTWCSNAVKIYLYASENAQYIALNSHWARHGRWREAPRPPILLARIPRPGVFEMAQFCPKFNTSHLKVYNTQLLLMRRYLLHQAVAPDKDACQTFANLQETMWRDAMDAKENFRKALGIEAMEAAYKSMFTLPDGLEASSAKHIHVHSRPIRNFVRLVLARWISAFRLRKVRKELDLVKSNHAATAKRQRKDA